jgi:ketosteroid isomerase-like protein
MTLKYWPGTILAAFILLVSGNAAAQGAADDAAVDDQAAVWSAVETIWTAQESDDDDWVEEMLSADFMGWPNNSPAPRSKSSVRMWNRFDQEQTNGITHELYPLSIVVHGDMAIVHYLYTNAVQTKSKQTDVSSGRYTDVLVRDDGAWKFISWHGGSDN